MAITEAQLREALADFMSASATRDPAKVAGALTRICDLEHQLSPEAPPMLRHYLERRSYQKALDFLKTGQAETESPKCGNS